MKAAFLSPEMPVTYYDDGVAESIPVMNQLNSTLVLVGTLCK